MLLLAVHAQGRTNRPVKVAARTRNAKLLANSVQKDTPANALKNPAGTFKWQGT